MGVERARDSSPAGIGAYGERTSAVDRLAPEGMRWIPGGTFSMGSADFYPEERPPNPRGRRT
jgi:hypothetical protein